LYWVGFNSGGFCPFRRFNDSLVRGDCFTFTEGVAKEGMADSYDTWPVKTLLASCFADTIRRRLVDFLEYFFFISSRRSFFSRAIFSSSSLLRTVGFWSDFSFYRLPFLSGFFFCPSIYL
jgi:hypothetical protein